MRTGLSMYGTTFSMGLRPEAGRPATGWRELMDRAAAFGLTGISLPATLLPEGEEPEIARAIRDRGQYLTVDAAGFDPAALAATIRRAARAGAEVVRTVAGGAKIGGDRRPLAGAWKPFLERVCAGLAQAAAEAERAGVYLAVENHQDLASEELLWLCETIASPWFGITLDAGNPLATAEEPLDYWRRVRPHVRNVHLKDYRIWLSDEGYRLVRCPLGQGVIDFPALFAILAEGGLDVPLSIELGALEARHIRVLADDFWPEYPPRTVVQFAGVMRFVLARAAPPDVDGWQTPYERGESAQAVAAYEERELADSVAYIRSIAAS